MARISIDYDKAIALAGKLEGQASECESIAADAKGIGSTLSDAWKGTSGDMMQSKVAEWVSQQNAQAAKLRNVAAAIRRTAEEIRKADMEAAAQAIRSILPKWFK